MKARLWGTVRSETGSLEAAHTDAASLRGDGSRSDWEGVTIHSSADSAQFGSYLLLAKRSGDIRSNSDFRSSRSTCAQPPPARPGFCCKNLVQISAERQLKHGDNDPIGGRDKTTPDILHGNCAGAWMQARKWLVILERSTALLSRIAKVATNTNPTPRFLPTTATMQFSSRLTLALKLAIGAAARVLFTFCTTATNSIMGTWTPLCANLE
uniref:Uncharacterized protein n=1 Tax=Mycena chlorophos TaxID=658473 RepID=A0ABQ0L996_MYCCL|nr:predicted protein [Mycena chlorophos]